MNKQKKSVVLFIDDDQAELDRFNNAFGSEFECVVGTTASICDADLSERKLKPDLCVLDLYFGSEDHPNSPQEIQDMAIKYAELDRVTRDFTAFLETIGQGSEWGLKLLNECQDKYKVPVVMLTRKGTLKDAIECFDNGAMAVLKKPMPNEMPEPEGLKEALDESMVQSSKNLADRFHRAIDTNSFRNKHRAWLGFTAGLVLTTVVSILIAIFF